MKLICSICTVTFNQVGHLSVHLQSLHAYSTSDAQHLAVDIETDTMAKELHNPNKMHQPDIECIIAPFACSPVTQVQASVVPF